MACARVGPGPRVDAVPNAPVEAPPGWLGVRAGAASPDWARITGTAPIVVLTEGAADALPAGSSAWGIGRNAAGPLVSLGPQTGRFGCDGGYDVAVTGLHGDVQGDLVWVSASPPRDARPLAVSVDGDDDHRVWQFGDHAVGLTRTGTFTADLWAGADRTTVRSIDHTTDNMDGYDPRPIRLTSDFRLPQVVAAWEIDGVPVAAAVWSSFEGVHFTVFRLGDPTTETDVAYLYQCGF